jgi:hypothetical protein
VKFCKIATFITSSFLLVYVLSGSDKITIRFSPPLGEKLTYNLDSLIKSDSVSLMGNDASLGASASGELTIKIERITSNNVYTSLTSDNLSVTLQSAVSTRNLDLSTDQDKALKIVFNRTGKVDEISNLAALKTQNIMNFSLVQIIRNYFPTLPSKPVEIGESWTENRQMVIPFEGMQLDVLLSIKYTLDSVIDTQAGFEAMISANYSVSLKGSKAFGKGTAVFDGSGKGNGYLHYLVNKGYFSEYRLDYEVDSDIKVKDASSILMQVPVHISANATLQLIK